ncbi:hypothetical protein [Undibacterium umbellatum]|uniref:AraC family transcriptional regulator n=1 Tax=Undibacterium umbellatum TaxID=2762300 RepID=A0ABR6ZD84_9BURK|nr:hypothetical protein [Undibacterium umbellatum]MBC3909708.1 hypothetical protein [Undibacterium umbellatum]
MNLNLFISHLGKDVSTSSLALQFSSIGIDLTNELVLPEGEFDCYIERPIDGICFVFTDDAMFLGKKTQALGSGPLYFSGIFLYAEGRDSYSQFRSDIPFGLSFTMKHEDMISKLGVPTWQRFREDGTLAADRWDNKAEVQIHISYSINDGRLVLVSLQKPNLS